MVIRSLQKSTQFLLTRLGFRIEHFQIEPGQFHGAKRIKLWKKRLSRTNSKNPKRLVIVPGFGDTPITWVPVMQILIAKLRLFVKKPLFDEIILLQFPGYLGCEKGEHCFLKSDDLIDSHHEVIRSLKPKLLVGQSMGAYLNSHFLATEPKENLTWLKRAVLFCPSGFIINGEREAEWQSILSAVHSGDATEFTKRALGKLVNHPFKQWIFGPIVKEMGDMLVREDIAGFLASFEAHHFLTDKLDHVSTPVTLGWGDLDQLIHYEYFAHWKKGFSKALGKKFRSITLKGAAHGVHMDSPLEVSNIILKSIQ